MTVQERSMKKFTLCVFFLIFILTSGAANADESGSRSITHEELRDHVYFLASDFMNGRAPGTAGYEIACQYAASQFRAMGMKPLLKDDRGNDTFLQTVPLLERRLKDFFLVLTGDEKTEKVPLGDLLKLSLFDYSSSPVQDVPVVFVGYGIQEKEAGWNDLEGLDLTGKVVLMLRGTPRKNEKPVLPQELEKKYGSPRGVMVKLEKIASHKPLAVIIPPSEGFSKNWEKRGNQGFWPKILLAEKESLYYPWIHTLLPRFGLIGTNLLIAKPEFFRLAMAGERYCPFSSDGSVILKDYQTFALNQVSVGFDFTYEDKSIISWNVVGLIPGTDPDLSSRVICTGAHLDHFPPRNGQVMNGADDNASGSAGVIEIAEALQLNPTPCSQLFVLFTSEELGLLGSRCFVGNCPLPIDSVKAFINVDMIGRTHKELKKTGGHYVALDTGLCPELWKLISRINSHSPNMHLELRKGLEYVTRTDQCYFHKRGIPSAGFDSGAHEDYHRPTDDAHKVDFDKMEKLSRLIMEILRELGKGGADPKR
jgi:hypothetical protein